MIIKPIFVDTSALIAIGNKRDVFHNQAVRIKDDLRLSNRNFVVTSAVILEFGNAFGAVNFKSSAIKIIEAIMQSEKWQHIIIDEQLIKRAFELYKQVKDKNWGLVDCTSIVVAKEMEITEIFTTDHHFQQAGFTTLLNRNIK
ncbi:MAG: type II toxin-antitoxin system VapC family toxin [Desulfamplus sp.]|nr:type II toxin-antitoxin system VapC family toxin [Desulfamplus sp.]